MAIMQSVGVFWNSTFFDVRFFFPVRFSFNWGQAGEQHLQVTSNINTLCRIAELPQIYPHLYDRLQRDFKDSEKAFNS